MDKLLVVDGNNLLFQMFYGMPARILSRSGRPIHATIGFVSVLQKIVKTYGIGEVAVVFDYDSSDERKEILPGYKANRIDNWDELPPEECPFTEEETIVRCLRFLGIEPLYSKGMEADDVIATLALRERSRREVLISSFDSDFFQLISPSVSVLRYRGKATVLFDEEHFKDVYGFPPSRYALYKAIVGDTSDNVPGVKGIGPKRGAALMKTLEETGSWEKTLSSSPWGKKVQDDLETVEKNLEVILLKERTELPLPRGGFPFDGRLLSLSNSQILESCGVFQ